MRETKHYFFVHIMSLSSFTRWIVTFFFIGLVIMLWWVWCAKYDVKWLRHIQQEKEHKSSEHTLLRDKLFEKNKKTEEYTFLKNRYEVLKVLYEKPVMHIVENILEEAHHQGYTIQNIKTSDEKNKGWYSTKKIDLEFSTSYYHTLISFLELLKKLHIKTMNCNISSKKRIVTCVYKGKIHWINDKE